MRPTLDPKAPGLTADPYPHYARLREENPIHRTNLGVWIVTRWADVDALLRNVDASVDEQRAPMIRRLRTLSARFREVDGEPFETALFAQDPPSHTRARHEIARAMGADRPGALRARVQTKVDRLLDDAATGPGSVEVMQGLAIPLPFAVITELLGLPGDLDVSALRALSRSATDVLDPLVAVPRTREISAAAHDLGMFLREVIAWKRKRLDRDDDVLARLLTDRAGGETLSEQELIENVGFLLLAGYETTVNLIGNGVGALLANRPQLTALIESPGLERNAVQELLRFDSPVQFTRRIILEPTWIGAHLIEPGEFVLLGLGAANRDPERFGADADLLRLTRSRARLHLSFGGGVHHCLGAQLARLQAEVAIGTLVRRFPGISAVSDTPDHNDRLVLRGLRSLEVSLR